MSVAEALSLMIQFGSLLISLLAFIVTIIFFLNQKK